MLVARVKGEVRTSMQLHYLRSMLIEKRIIDVAMGYGINKGYVESNKPKELFYKMGGLEMREKLTLATPIIGLILIIGILILSNNLYNLNTTVEAIKSNENIQNHLEEKITSIENRISNLEFEMPNQNLDQFIKATILELDRIEDLLNKVDGLETIYGTITELDKSREIILNVELADTQENVQIKLADNCTQYMIAQFARAPIDTEEFLKLLEEDLKNESPQGFTFKIVNGKAVQIYQGWGGLI